MPASDVTTNVIGRKWVMEMSYRRKRGMNLKWFKSRIMLLYFSWNKDWFLMLSLLLLLSDIIG